MSVVFVYGVLTNKWVHTMSDGTNKWVRKMNFLPLCILPWVSVSPPNLDERIVDCSNHEYVLYTLLEPSRHERNAPTNYPYEAMMLPIGTNRAVREWPKPRIFTIQASTLRKEVNCGCVLLRLIRLCLESNALFWSAAFGNGDVADVLLNQLSTFRWPEHFIYRAAAMGLDNILTAMQQ